MKITNNKEPKSKRQKVKYELLIFTVAVLFMFTLVILTKYIGSTDVGDYADVAKFFSGDYLAKIRSSHSYSYGFINFPFVELTHNFLGMKLMSIVWLILIILSLYFMSKKDKKILYLSLSAPIFWYMAPWINPIQISSLFFLWGYHFIKRFNETNTKKYLFYSGIFVGFSMVFWNTMLYFSIILALCFLWNKKISHVFLFFFSLFVGFLPLLILDQVLFHFPLYSTFRWIFGTILNILGLTSGGGAEEKSLINILIVFIIFPIFSYVLFKPKNFSKDKQTSFFLIFSLLVILTNPQIRYTLVLIPIIILNLKEKLTEKQIKTQIIISIILSLLVITPYLIQINYSTNWRSFDSMIKNPLSSGISIIDKERLINEDLISISNDFPHSTFVVGNKDDDYQTLAHIYWGDKINEFVSIQDYKLYTENETIIFQKEFRPSFNINERREIWITGGISKKSPDTTNYGSIKYALSEETEIDLNGFELMKSYKILKVFEKKI